MALAPQSVFRGTDCELYMEGQWLTNVTSVEANVEINQSELNLLGHWWTVYRNMGLSGSGSMNGVFVTTELISKIGSIQDGKEFRTELVIKNTNPDVGKTYRVRLKNVVFTNIPLGNFAAGEIAEQEFNFTFGGYEIIDPVN
ncbi:MAG TPA: phage tail tube protein [Pseudoneobacillus sp.]|nr:phage tail tube protein [Pseudoneobacillus sp.]